MTSVSEKEWNSYFTQLNDLEKKSVLAMLKTFLQRSAQNEGRISIDQYNQEIDEAVNQASEGNCITQEEMEKKASKW